MSGGSIRRKHNFWKRVTRKDGPDPGITDSPTKSSNLGALPECIMIDDTRETICTVSPSQLSSCVEEIRQHRIDRKLAKGWARSLRFLTFDDEPLDADVSLNQPQKSSKESCARCELGVSVPSPGHECYSHRRGLRDSFSKPSSQLNACKHVTRLTCSYCKHVPLFPNRAKATKFRIRRVIPRTIEPIGMHLKDYDMRNHNEFPCGHFVAVSYCWSAQPKRKTDGDLEEKEQLYTVVEEDGSIRPARAPRAIIDRAVAFAAQNGYRMIWIDQECIEQNNDLEKALGVQAMDFVYVNAHITIGLYSTVLKQEHLDNLLKFEQQVADAIRLELKGPVSKQQRNQIVYEQILAEGLIRIVHDPWNSRAWILQEAFASAENMLILLPQASGVSAKHLRLVCHQMSSTEICINFEVLYRCLKVAGGLVSKLPDDVKMEDAIKKLQWFCPSTPDQRQTEMSVGGTRPRDTCNAAVALSFLRLRHNSVVADRLAIIANLCGYELRFNSLTLQQSQRSLAMCILTLSVVNGDLSLLTPEMHTAPSFHQISNISFAENIVTYLRGLGTVRSTSLAPRGPSLGPAAPESYYFTGATLRVPGFLWKLCKTIALHDIQKQYRGSWDRLNEQRTRIIAEYHHRFHRFKGSQILAGGPFIDYTKRRERAITQILFESLTKLKELGEYAAADAIWQSVWNPNWLKTSIAHETIQSVKQFPSDIRAENRRGMFNLVQLDSPIFHSEWLIDRIMKHGNIQLACLVRTSEQDQYKDYNIGKDNQLNATRLQLSDLIDKIHEDEEEEEEEKVQAKAERVESEQSSILSKENVKSKPSLKELYSDLGGNLTQLALASYMLQQVTEIFISSLVVYPTSQNPTKFTRSTACTNQLALFGSLFESGFTRSEFLAGQCAIFDIDSVDLNEETLILTPFQLPLERTASTELRHMSISRVVERVKEGLDEYETYQTKRLVKGMWQLMVFPGGRYNLV